MSASRIVIDVFTGVSDNLPIAINVRYKDVVRRIYVGFGEIRIPFFASADVDVERLEREHECRIKWAGKGWIITPNVVGRIIEKNGFLCSASEKHRKVLEGWMKAHGGIVIKTLLGL